MLMVGEKAPLDVTVVDQTHERVSLADHLGHYVVIYFYPKDDTPGCTTEACSIRDWMSALTSIGVLVIGVSTDSPESHLKFIEKYGLNFTLWSDPDHRLMEAFGTWQTKKHFGKEYFGTTRSTFIIDPSGSILNVWENVTPEDHGKEIADFLIPVNEFNTNTSHQHH